MSVTIEAIYENGVLRPLEKLDLKDKQRVRMRLDVDLQAESGEADVELSDQHAHAALFPPGHPLHGLKPISREHAEDLRRITEEAFERLDPEDWE